VNNTYYPFLASVYSGIFFAFPMIAPFEWPFREDPHMAAYIWIVVSELLLIFGVVCGISACGAYRLSNLPRLSLAIVGILLCLIVGVYEGYIYWDTMNGTV